MLSPFRLRGLLSTLVGTLVLTTLWVTSITLLSARPAATDLLTEAGTQILNPFLVGQGLGLSRSTYTTLEVDARAHPGQALPLSVLKVRVVGNEVVGRSYPAVVQLVYGRLAEAYYDGGAQAAFAVPSKLTAEVPNFGMFTPNKLPMLPGAAAPVQLPAFLQPFFTFVGLTPDTFTASGHQKLARLLPWFWIALAALSALSVVLHPGEQRLAGLLQGVMHGSWPVVMMLAGLWVLSRVYTSTFAPYTGLLGTISRAFLPIYGTAFALGLAGVVVTKVLASGRARGRQTPAMVAVGAGYPGFSGTPHMPSGETESGWYIPPSQSQSAAPYQPDQSGLQSPFPPHSGDNW